MCVKNISVKGQSLGEVVIFLGVITLAMIGMQVYIQRGLQGKAKDLTDVIINPEHLKQRAYSSDDATSSGSTRLSDTTKVTTLKGGSVIRDVNETMTSTSKSWDRNKP